MGEILRCASFLRQGKRNDGVTAIAKETGKEKGKGGRERRREGDAIRATLPCGAVRRIFVAAEARPTRQMRKANAKGPAEAVRYRRKNLERGFAGMREGPRMRFFAALRMTA